ncbi:receptor-like protein 6 [Medicago truncatula]|uniref:Verticillium wilt resistance-like protein n=2 Tax=Medicago truncatula TaxID=3880 RepID=A0A072UHN6_MEDTR|nr:receptor-like protein 6 [Medicago truncatula]KEH28921.1 verticillium wilt resistance-like protein [Medicago truncatula]
MSFQISVASAKCLEDQQSLLLQIKNNLTFEADSFNKLEQWNQSIPCCNWSGVTCDNEGQVIGLDLRNEVSGGFDNSSGLFSIQKLTKIRMLYLDGISIPSQGYEWSSLLLPFRDLQELGMSSCGLSGPLDSSLSKLENLSVIILGDNNFSSPVPQTFANFKNLTTLSLVDCGLTGTFPQNIFQIETLSVIDLSFNYNLHGSFPDYSLSESLHSIIVSYTNFSGALPSSIGKLRHLSKLDLSSCQFNGTLPNSLSNLTHLSYLDLSNNSFTGPMPPFGMVKNLIHLDLSDNSLSGEIPLSSNFEGLENLEIIDLSYNSIDGRIPTDLFSLLSIQEIHLSFNHFNTVDEFTIISPSSLNTLDLSSNHLSGPFPTSIFQLGSLKELDLSSNKFNGSLLLDKILELGNLTELNLSYNNISINGNVANVDQSSIPCFFLLELASCNLKFFPSFLKNQNQLSVLDLSNNQIQGIVPNWIWKMQGLEILNISHNFLTDLEGPLPNLTNDWMSLDLHNNKLQGSIPAFLEYVQYLDCSMNKFSVIPQDIGNSLPSLRFLSLSNNNLHGSIPESLCNLSLQVLDISFNNISGTISPCLIRMTSSTLLVLNLRMNNINGPIPDMFPTSCVASTLNFHGNLLQGPIPKSLSHCTSLKVLDIGSNQIVGGFPCFLKHIPTLSVLVLRNNRLHGSIECSLSLAKKPWKRIQILDMAFNNFSGKLPEFFFTTWERMMNNKDDGESDFIYIGDRELTSYSYYQDSMTVSIKGQQIELVKILKIFTAIDLSSNHFEGPLPNVLMDFKALYVLNFSNNALSGEIPSTIGNLKQLESLDLSNNSLVGKIPVQIASLSFLSFLNLSINHLVGKIPTGTQLQSFEASSFEGNDGLYGPPLTETPNDGPDKPHPQPACERFACSIDWNFLSVELGFVFGLGIIVGPLLFWKKWRVSYWKLVDKILCLIFQRMHFEYATDRGQTYRILRW